MRAAGGIDVDLAEAVGALLGCGSSGSFRSRLLHQILGLVDRLDNREEHKSHQQEVDNSGNEVAVGELSSVFTRAECDCPMGEIQTAEDGAENRHDDVVDEGVDNALECAADDNADCQIHHIAFADERFELGNKAFHDRVPSFLNDSPTIAQNGTECNRLLFTSGDFCFILSLS